MMFLNALPKFLSKRAVSVTAFRSASHVSGSYKAEGPFNFVNGQRCDSSGKGKKIFIEEPATGLTIGEFAESCQEDVNMAVELAAKAQKEWGQVTANERGKLLINVARKLKERQEEIARVEVYDTGKSIWEARLDVQTAIDSLQYYGGLAASLSGQFYSLQKGSFGYTRREPLGVVVGIGAWNYPIQMAGWKSAPALACGNSVVFKPSQFTPMSAVMLAEVFIESGLPPNLFNVVQGAVATGNFLTSHPTVAKVTFTGSVETGSKVMKNCADGIKHVTLELGGKSPLVIFDDCDQKNAVNAALMANFLTQGQVCSNGTRVFVQKLVYDDILMKLKARTEAIKHDDPHLEGTKMGAMIHADQAKRVQAFINHAKFEGAEVVCGGDLRKMDGKLAGGSYIDPCILLAKDEMQISREEVFGPVMNVYSFTCEEEVIERANNTQFGLASGVFTNDLMRAHRVAAKLEAGNVYVNNYNMYPVELPFGGYKKSGLGRENGTCTLDYFSQFKSVYVEAEDVWCPY